MAWFLSTGGDSSGGCTCYRQFRTTVTAGNTTAVFTDSYITEDRVFEAYAEGAVVGISSIECTGNTCTVTFMKALSEDVEILLRVSDPDDTTSSSGGNCQCDKLELFDVATTAWVANTDDDTKDDYPYVATIGTTQYKDDSAPIWMMTGAYAGDVKNLLNPTLATTTSNGVTCTNNGDGTYTLSGTATADTEFRLGEFDLPIGTYKYFGTPNGGSTTTYRMGGSNFPNLIGENAEVRTWSETKNVKPIIYVYNGYTCNNLLFKPMVTEDLTVTYNDFTPYGVNIKGIPTADETAAIGKIMQAYFTSTNITLYATDEITVALKLRVKGV